MSFVCFVLYLFFVSLSRNASILHLLPHCVNFNIIGPRGVALPILMAWTSR